MPDRYSLKVQQMQRLEAKQQPLQVMSDRSAVSGQRQGVTADGSVQYGQKLSNAAQDGEPISLLQTPTGAAIDGRNVLTEQDNAVAPPWNSGLVMNAIDVGINMPPALGNAEGYLRGQLWARPEEGEIRWEFAVARNDYFYHNTDSARWQGFRLEPIPLEDAVLSTGIAVGLVSAPNGAIVSGKVEGIVLAYSYITTPDFDGSASNGEIFPYGSLATIGYMPNRLLEGKVIQGVKFFEDSGNLPLSDFLTRGFWFAPDQSFFFDDRLAGYKRIYRQEETDPFVGQPILINFPTFYQTNYYIYRQLQPRSFSGFLPPGDHAILILANLASTNFRGGVQSVPLYLETPDYWNFQIDVTLL